MLRTTGRSPSDRSTGMVTPPTRPMPLIRVASPFDHPEWLFELKHDGFRHCAGDGHLCTLVSRRRQVLQTVSAARGRDSHSIRAQSAVTDGEIVCLGGWPPRCLIGCCSARMAHFVAFDVLSIDGEDLRDRRSSTASAAAEHYAADGVAAALHGSRRRRGADLFAAVARATSKASWL